MKNDNGTVQQKDNRKWTQKNIQTIVNKTELDDDAEKKIIIIGSSLLNDDVFYSPICFLMQ